MPSKEKEITRPFRFFDNREKYLLFVNTCSEKKVIADRVGKEIAHINPTPPAFYLFDAGMGDGTVLNRLMRDMHRRFPNVPFFIVGKEISLEDARLSLDKLADRFFEHPQTIFILTNLYYSEATRLYPKDPKSQKKLRWWKIPLEGQTAYTFDGQIRGLQPILEEGWQTRTSPKTGNPLYVCPSVLVLYRADQRFLLDRIIPQPGQFEGFYDLVVAAQPYRARSEASVKIKHVLGPLARSLRSGGRMIVVQSTGHDPGMEIVHKIWPEENPFQTPRHVLVEELKKHLKDEASRYTFNYSDEHSLFTYHMHALPDEVSSNIGTSTLLAAWNAAVYVAQIEDRRLTEALSSGDYLEATREVIQRHGGLWFLDESFTVVREKEAQLE